MHAHAIGREGKRGRGAGRPGADHEHIGIE